MGMVEGHEWMLNTHQRTLSGLQVEATQGDSVDKQDAVAHVAFQTPKTLDS